MLFGAGVGAIGGAVVGGVAGSELAAALRAVILLLIKASTKLTEILQFLQKFMKGNILQFLKAIKFAQYGSPILSAVKSFSGKLIEIVKGLAHYIDMLPSTQYTRNILAKLSEWERSFYAVQTDAAKWVPKALAELDVRLTKALAEVAQTESHVVPAGIKAPVHNPPAPPKQEVRDVPGRVFKDAEEAKPAAGSGGSGAPKSTASSGGAPTPPPKKPDEKPPRKDTPDKPPPADAKANHKVQEVKDPVVEVAAVKSYKTKNMKDKYVGENLPGNEQWKYVNPNAKVDYLTPEKLAKTKLTFKDGKAYDAKGNLFDTSSAPGGRAIYVMDAEGNFYASDKAREGYFHHSSFLAGKPVAAAGEIEGTEGILTAISDRSGHYQPEPELIENAMKELEAKGVEK